MKVYVVTELSVEDSSAEVAAVFAEREKAFAFRDHLIDTHGGKDELDKGCRATDVEVSLFGELVVLAVQECEVRQGTLCTVLTELLSFLKCLTREDSPFSDATCVSPWMRARLAEAKALQAQLEVQQ